MITQIGYITPAEAEFPIELTKDVLCYGQFVTQLEGHEILELEVDINHLEEGMEFRYLLYVSLTLGSTTTRGLGQVGERQPGQEGDITRGIFVHGMYMRNDTLCHS
jgi:hypothetical protein